MMSSIRTQPQQQRRAQRANRPGWQQWAQDDETPTAEKKAKPRKAKAPVVQSRRAIFTCVSSLGLAGGLWGAHWGIYDYAVRWLSRERLREGPRHPQDFPLDLWYRIGTIFAGLVALSLVTALRCAYEQIVIWRLGRRTRTLNQVAASFHLFTGPLRGCFDPVAILVFILAWAICALVLITPYALTVESVGLALEIGVVAGTPLDSPQRNETIWTPGKQYHLDNAMLNIPYAVAFALVTVITFFGLHCRTQTGQSFSMDFRSIILAGTNLEHTLRDNLAQLNELTPQALAISIQNVRVGVKQSIIPWDSSRPAGATARSGAQGQVSAGQITQGQSGQVVRAQLHRPTTQRRLRFVFEGEGLSEGGLAALWPPPGYSERVGGGASRQSATHV